MNQEDLTKIISAKYNWEMWNVRDASPYRTTQIHPNPESEETDSLSINFPRGNIATAQPVSPLFLSSPGIYLAFHQAFTDLLYHWHSLRNPFLFCRMFCLWVKCYASTNDASSCCLRVTPWNNRMAHLGHQERDWIRSWVKVRNSCLLIMSRSPTH